MTTKIRIVLCLFVMMVIPSALTAQKISPEKFISVLKEKENKINTLHQGIVDVPYYLDLNNAEIRAYETSHPQAYIDLLVVRFERIQSKLNYAKAKVAGELANYIRTYGHTGIMSAEALNEGVAKYTEMKRFCQEAADEQNREYLQLWKKFKAQYPYIGTEELDDDDAYLRQYGAY